MIPGQLLLLRVGVLPLPLASSSRWVGVGRVQTALSLACQPCLASSLRALTACLNSSFESFLPLGNSGGGICGEVLSS